MRISIVIPVYNAEKIISQLINKIILCVTQITVDYEIILVEDCGSDNSWNEINKLAHDNSKIIGVKLSRNFGQHYAITAGLDLADGDWVVIMDCDFQDPPESIVDLYQRAIQGFDIVLAIRENRLDAPFKKISSKVFNKFLSYISDMEFDHRVGAFRILSKEVVGHYKLMRESHRFFGGMISWLGFKVDKVSVPHGRRFEGESSYDIRKSFKLAMDGIFSFSHKPLMLAIKFGLMLVLISSIFILYKIVMAMLTPSSVVGWSSLIASVFFSTGLIICILGLVGLYVGRIFEQVKNRPLYVIQKRIN